MTDTATESPSLDDLFGPCLWLPREGKRGSLAIADGFDAVGGQYSKLAARMRECGSILEFACYRIGDDEALTRRLVRCSWCRVRLCFLCERARARKRQLQVCRVGASWFAARPSDQAILLTLTTKSVGDGELLDAIDHLMASLRRLTRCKRFKTAVPAWYRTIEVTRNAETGLWHPHVHMLLIVSPSYFRRTSGNYIHQREWAELWRKFARLDYDPVVDIRALDGVGGGPLGETGRKSLAEIAKYCTKPSDLVQFDEDGEPYPVDPHVLKTLYDALRGRRLVGMSKALSTLWKQLDLGDPENDDPDSGSMNEIPDDAVYVGREFYRWHAGLSDYVYVPRPVWPQQQEETQMPP